jgi:Leucine-rich repeat (LRR) protein
MYLKTFLFCLMQMSLLNVSGNKLKALPESIGGCKSLEELQTNGKFIISNSPSYLRMHMHS